MASYINIYSFRQSCVRILSLNLTDRNAKWGFCIENCVSYLMNYLQIGVKTGDLYSVYLTNATNFSANVLIASTCFHVVYLLVTVVVFATFCVKFKELKNLLSFRKVWNTLYCEYVKWIDSDLTMLGAFV